MVQQLLVLPQLAVIQEIMSLALLAAILVRLDLHVPEERQRLFLVALDKYPTWPSRHA